MQLAIGLVNRLSSIRNLDNYYNILGIPRNATNREIKAAYYRLALKHHPDHGGNENDFIEISQAYKALLNNNENNMYSYQLRLIISIQLFLFIVKLQQNTTSFDTEFLADEIKLHILRYLPINALIAVSQASKTWRRLSGERELWKLKLLEACPGISLKELEYLEKNGGYKNACLILEYLIKNVFNVDAIVSAAKKFPQVGMLFFIGYKNLVNIGNNKFFENQFIKLGSHFSKIAVTSVQAAKSLLNRADLMHNECGPYIRCLEEIAGINIEFAKLVLYQYPNVVKDQANRYVEAVASIGGFDFDFYLGIFFVNVDEKLGHPAGFMREFIDSDFFQKNYTRNHIDLVY